MRAWNFGPDGSDVKPVFWMADRLLSLWGGGVTWRQDESYQPHEDNYLILDCAQSRHKLKWEPTLDLSSTLRWIVRWVKDYQAGEDMRRVTERQIDDFTSLLCGGVRRAEGAHAAHDIPPMHELVHFLDLVHETVMERAIDGTIRFWNRGAEEMYGWKSAEAVGHVSHALLRTEFPQPLEQIDAELVNKGQWEGNLIHVRRDGTRIAVKSRWAIRADDLTQPQSVLEVNNSILAEEPLQERSHK